MQNGYFWYRINSCFKCKRQLKSDAKHIHICLKSEYFSYNVNAALDVLPSEIPTLKWDAGVLNRDMSFDGRNDA